MTSPSQPVPTVTPAPNSRLETFVALYADAKPAADAAAERLKQVTDGIKAELAAAAPGQPRVDLHSPLLPNPLRLQAKTSWRLDTKTLKENEPETYVRYAVQSTTWELRQVTS